MGTPATTDVTRMRYLRLSYGLDLKDVAAQLGISVGYLSKLECGWFRRIPQYLAKNIIEFYGEGFDSLMEMTELPRIQSIKKVKGMERLAKAS